jgi:hypothetical protein
MVTLTFALRPKKKIVFSPSQGELVCQFLEKPQYKNLFFVKNLVWPPAIPEGKERYLFWGH